MAASKIGSVLRGIGDAARQAVLDQGVGQKDVPGGIQMSRQAVIGFVVAALIVGGMVESYVGSSQAEGAPAAKESQQGTQAGNTLRRLEARVAELEARVSKMEKERGTVLVTSPPIVTSPSVGPENFSVPGGQSYEFNGMTIYNLLIDTNDSAPARAQDIDRARAPLEGSAAQSSNCGQAPLPRVGLGARFATLRLDSFSKRGDH
jgi:hypothetical protein